MTTTTKTAPRVYVSTYTKYNNGSLEGDWVDLSDFSDFEGFKDFCKELHKDEEDPEFMFQDWEGLPDCFHTESGGEKDFEPIFEFLEMDEDDRKILEMYAEATGYSISDITLSDAQDAFHGTAEDEAEFAERIAEDCGDIPKDMPSWIVIDWGASWKCNLRHDYNTATDEDGVMYFFHNN